MSELHFKNFVGDGKHASGRNDTETKRKNDAGVRINTSTSAMGGQGDLSFLVGQNIGPNTYTGASGVYKVTDKQPPVTIGPNTYTGPPGGSNAAEYRPHVEGQSGDVVDALSWDPLRYSTHSRAPTLNPSDTRLAGEGLVGSDAATHCNVSSTSNMPVSDTPGHTGLVSPSTPTEPNTIGHLMSITEIVAQLKNHGCQDITALLDLSTSGVWPVSTGGFGDVYKINLLDSTEIALKTARMYVSSSDEGKRSLKRAARELHTWSKCDHRNVLKLLGLAVFRGQLGMVSLWMAHGSLPQYLSRYPEVDRCKIATQISEGLAYLHASNIVHGDLKGMNVLVSGDGVPALSDFGNAVLSSQSLRFTATTTSAAFSLRWTAPEILCSEGPSVCSKEADVYSLGMTILETITGRLPYAEKSEQAVMFCVWRGVLPDRPMEISHQSGQGDDLWLLLCRCWSKSADQRPGAAEVTENVSAYLYGDGPPVELECTQIGNIKLDGLRVLSLQRGA